ncbi:hypothetical protein Hdeb2414_s0028g00701721 [Helianthus debilis subsp. tardiflorus]
MNRDGERGSTCLRPLLKANSSVGEPLTKTEPLPDFRQPAIQLTQVLGNPIQSRTFNRNFQFKVLYALAKSTFKIKTFFLAFFAQDTTSLTTRGPSKIFLSPTKAG